MAQTRKKQVQPEFGPDKAFGIALREVRTAKGLSQEGLADEAGVDRTYVSLMERGIKSPTLRMLIRLAAILGVTAGELVGRTEAIMSAARSPTRKTPPPD
ncbi:helix-turn-helix domain-containing protein [Paludibaculum fermentans]|uniref:helix-turn-helix domain-containing protein n=1 Tax=Paludibaculum fermentans TaxID=1473598 RepID=UPI003EBBCD55